MNNDPEHRRFDDRGRTRGKKAVEPPAAADAQDETPIEAFEEEGAGIAAKE